MSENRQNNEPIEDKHYRKKSESGSDFVKYAALTSTPYIIIVYPIVGFVLGWLPVHFWNWPAWFPVITLVLGLVQGIREVMKVGSRIDSED